MAVSFEHEAETNNNAKAKILAEALDNATVSLLENGKSPSRKVKELDNRGSHFYIALYWAQELAKQTVDEDLQAKFSTVAKSLENNEKKIIEELNSIQGTSIDIQGYYSLMSKKAEDAMRPSPTLNDIIEAI